jgi:Tol biopolymer transport system component
MWKARVGTTGAALALIAIVVSAAGPAPTAQRAKKALTLENIVGRQSGARQAAISPDGKLVAIGGEGPEGSGIYLVNTAGSAAPKLWLQGNGAVWFPDSQRIVFSRDTDLWTASVGSNTARPRSRRTDGRWRSIRREAGIRTSGSCPRTAARRPNN